ncbi:hypothetical protein [Nocardia paucivorans]|uniref:hypothetical protein n=1 Tax=Nocardia paucivorans TaxID=114259 RepID=UPI00030B2850|nr:hypothetical protein [Nocardia paucivorans]
MYPDRQSYSEQPPQGYPTQPPQGNWGQGQFEVSAPGPIEVTHLSDQATGRALSRVTALMTWRLPALWIFVMVLPVLVLLRGTFRLLTRKPDTTVDPSEIFGAFFVVLVFELVILVLVTGWTMVRGNPNVRRYSQPGTQMWARYTHDALHLRLPHTADIHLPYPHIKRLYLFRDVVYLRKNDGKNFALPRTLAPKAALSLMRDAGVRI